MTRFISVLTAASLFIAAPMALTPAIAGPADADMGVVDFCKTHSGAFPLETQGDCISLLTSLGRDARGFYTHICQFFMTSRPDDFYAAYDTLNECVRDTGTNLP